MLQQMNRLQRPVMSGEGPIGVHVRAVPPVGREPSHGQVEQVFLVPELRGRSQLDVQRAVPRRSLEGPVSVSQFRHVQHDVGRIGHASAEVIERLPPSRPAVGVAVGGGHVERLRLGPWAGGIMDVRIRECVIDLLIHCSGSLDVVCR